MLNIKNKSILAMLLVLCLTMGLVACGSSGAKDNVTDSGATNSGQRARPKTTMTEDLKRLSLPC